MVVLRLVFKKGPPLDGLVLWLYFMPLLTYCTGLFWEPVDSRHSVAASKNALVLRAR